MRADTHLQTNRVGALQGVKMVISAWLLEHSKHSIIGSMFRKIQHMVVHILFKITIRPKSVCTVSGIVTE